MGSTFPRVTHVLEAVGLGADFSRARPEDLERGRIRGTLVHQAVEALTYHYFDGAPPEVAGYVDAYQRFLRESKFVPIAAEFEVVHEAWKYVGHPDVIGWLGKTRLLLDAKTGEDEGVEYQLAAYKAAWDHQHPQEPVGAVAGLALRDNGTYRFNEIATADLEQATTVWFAALTVYHAREARQRRAA